MTKTYRRRDRTWRDCISLEEFQHIARETVGRDRPNKEADDWCKSLFGNVASPGVKDPLRRKQREETIFADLERAERGRRDGGHKSKGHNIKKRKRAIDSNSGLLEDRRPRHRGSTYLENVGQVTEGNPSRAVLAQQRGPVSPVSPVTPTRPRLSRRLAPLGSMTNVAATDPTTSPESPLDCQGHDPLWFGEDGKEGGSKMRLSGSPDPLVDDERSGRVSLYINPFTNLPPIPSLPSSSRRRMDSQGDVTLYPVPGNLQVKIGVRPTTPPAPQIDSEHHSQSIAGRSLPTPVSNGPIKRLPPPADLPVVIEAEALSIGVKRTRNEEDVSYPSKKVVLTRPPPSVQAIPDSSRNSKPPETWSPDETTFMMESPHSTRDVSRSKNRKGGMSVDAIKARLIRATSILQILPSEKPDPTVLDPTVLDPTVATGMCDVKPTKVVRENTLEGETEPVYQKAGSPASMFGIPAPFPPGTSGPGLSLKRPNNSDKIAAYHGADKFYSGRPPSVTPRQPPEVFESTNEGKKSPVRALGEDTKQGVSTGQLGQPKPEGSRMTLGRLPSFVLAPQQLSFTDTAVGTLMSTSVVWLARGVLDPEPTYRPSSLQLVPRMNEVSQLESLLVACGWHRKKGFTSKRGIDRGVVFVDYEEQADVLPVIKTHWVVQQCENAYQLATQHQTAIERGMKPIWIMDANVLRWETLRLMRSGDPLDTLEEFVLWKKA